MTYDYKVGDTVKLKEFYDGGNKIPWISEITPYVGKSFIIKEIIGGNSLELEGLEKWNFDFEQVALVASNVNLWQKSGDHKMVYREVADGIYLRDIFNFARGERMCITQDVNSNSISTVLQNFNDVAPDLMQEAEAEYLKAGGKIKNKKLIDKPPGDFNGGF